MSATLAQEEAKQTLQKILMEKRIVVCCGAGGVGKTTTSAALGVAAAMLGRRTLVLTIDPARRLADALGISIDSHVPNAVDTKHWEALDIDAKSSLSLWMLQSQPVFDRMVRSLSDDDDKTERLFAMPIYQAIRQLVAGMQEYMAGESLYQFYKRGEYDLIILDTPPSRNAIDFLAAPDRLLRFLDSRILRVFAPPKGGWSIFQRARRVVSKTFEQVAGDGFLSQAQEFVGLFLDIFDVLKEHAETVRDVLSSEESTHLLVTSPDPAALQEALYFQKVLQERTVPFGGFLLNRSLADHPTRSWEEEGAPEVGALQTSFEKLQPLIKYEHQLISEHRALYERLDSISSSSALTIATPHLGEDIEDLKGLSILAKFLLPDESPVATEEAG